MRQIAQVPNNIQIHICVFQAIAYQKTNSFSHLSFCQFLPLGVSANLLKPVKTSGKKQLLPLLPTLHAELHNICKLPFHIVTHTDQTLAECVTSFCIISSLKDFAFIPSNTLISSLSVWMAR